MESLKILGLSQLNQILSLQKLRPQIQSQVRVDKKTKTSYHLEQHSMHNHQIAQQLPEHIISQCIQVLFVRHVGFRTASLGLGPNQTHRCQINHGRTFLLLHNHSNSWRPAPLYLHNCSRKRSTSSTKPSSSATLRSLKAKIFLSHKLFKWKRLETLICPV